MVQMMSSAVMHSPQKMFAFLATQLAARPPMLGALATCGADNVACVRTVVVRGVEYEARLVWISSHVRAGKINALRRRPMSELSMWFGVEHVQVRLLAKWQLIDRVAASASEVEEEFWKNAWAMHSSASKQLFFAPAPGQALSAQPSGRLQKTTKAVDPQVPPATFAVLKGTVTRVDVLSIDRAAHRRFLHEHSRGKWKSREITP